MFKLCLRSKLRRIIFILVGVLCFFLFMSNNSDFYFLRKNDAIINVAHIDTPNLDVEYKSIYKENTNATINNGDNLLTNGSVVDKHVPLNAEKVPIASHYHSVVKQDKPIDNIVRVPGRMYSIEQIKRLIRTDADFLTKVLDQDYLLPNTKDVLKRYFLDEPYTFAYNAITKSQLKQNYDINSDVIVFLHMQKTGGMHFNDRVTKELQKPFVCKCRSITKTTKGKCNCLNPKDNMWFYTTAYSGWQCGLHADWAQMHKCLPSLVDKIENKNRTRRYFYFTQLRDAVTRYLSEYHHQTFTNHWQDAILGCGDIVNANKVHVKPCFSGPNWRGVKLDQFMDCKDNLATHRMTRMISDLTLTDCYKNFTDPIAMKKRAPIWLKSAMDNLETMEYIGLMEDEAASDKLFHRTYNLTFKHVLRHSESGSAGAQMRFTEDQFLRILRLTELDIHLYLFGKDLFYQRLKEAG